MLARIRFWRNVDRLGPDIPYTHWRLYFPKLMKNLGKRLFDQFGSGAEFRPGAYAVACKKISIGSNVIIRPGSMLFADPGEQKAGRIDIEDDVMIGSGVHIYVTNHRFEDPHVPLINQGDAPTQNVLLKNGCWVGANSIILPGVTIGANTVIGAGSIVTKSIPDRVIAAGNPAIIIRKLA